MNLPSPTTHPARIAAMVVTFNRIDLLMKCLAALRSQTRAPDEIIVIDNGSNDGTSSWLNHQSDVTVIRQENLGGSGGQARGICEACSRGHDWAWCMDDDTLPEPGALAALVERGISARPDAGFFCSLVYWQPLDSDCGSRGLHRMNLPIPDTPDDWLEDLNVRRLVPVKACSFVSVMVSTHAVRVCGLPIRKMFIWLDDVEFTRRIAARFGGYLVLDSEVLHKTPGNAGMDFSGMTPALLTKFLYGARNHFFLLCTREHSPFPVRGWEVAADFRRMWRWSRALGSLALRVRLMRWALAGIFFFRPRIEYPPKVED